MNALKYFREKESMSQKELADALGVQSTSISVKRHITAEPDIRL